MKRGANIPDKRVTFGLLSILLKSSNESGRVILKEDPLCMKLLSDKSNLNSGSMKLRTKDRRLKEVGAISCQKSTLRATDNKTSSVSLIPNIVVEVNFDKLRGWGLPKDG